MNAKQRQVYDAIEALGGEAYGVPIAEKLWEGDPSRYSIGWLYVELNRLERAGWLATREEPGGPERGYRHKVFYRIVRRPEEEKQG